MFTTWSLGVIGYNASFRNKEYRAGKKSLSQFLFVGKKDIGLMEL